MELHQPLVLIFLEYELEYVPHTNQNNPSIRAVPIVSTYLGSRNAR